MDKRIKYFLIIFSTAIITLCAVVIYLVRTNTSFLTFRVSDEDLNENNSNDDLENAEEIDLTELQAKKLFVPNDLKAEFNEDRTLYLPEGFEISVYATGLGSARHMDFDDEGNIYITDRDGKVWLVKNMEGDYSTEKILIDDSLLNAHGIALYNGDLYVAEEREVLVYRGIQTNGTYSSKEVLIPNLPVGGHITRTVIIGPDEKLYLSIGSSCNVCEEGDSRRAAIVRYNLDGSGEEIFASGLRNSVGFTFDSKETIWSVDNGRDLIGDDLPPEEVNIIEQGNHYGWPYCYGSGNANPEYSERTEFCTNESKYPTYEMQAHSAPLGIEYIEVDTLNDFLPEEFQHNVVIGFHGSWNRSTPTGYKVVRINTDTADENSGVVIDFITGWLEGNANAWGRPVDVKVGPDDALYISDDQAGVIYRVSYSGDI